MRDSSVWCWERKLAGWEWEWEEEVEGWERKFEADARGCSWTKVPEGCISIRGHQ